MRILHKTDLKEDREKKNKDKNIISDLQKQIAALDARIKKLEGVK